MELARAETPVEAAVAGRAGTIDLRRGLDLVFDNLVNLRVFGPVYLVDVEVRVCGPGRIFDVFDLHIEKDGCGILCRVARGRDTGRIPEISKCGDRVSRHSDHVRRPLGAEDSSRVQGSGAKRNDRADGNRRHHRRDAGPRRKPGSERRRAGTPS